MARYTVPAKPAALFAALAAALMLGACAQDGKELQSGLFDGKSSSALKAEKEQAEAEQASALPKSELEKATEYWGKRFKTNPNDPEAALSYAKNLKAMGEKQLALGILQQASASNGRDKKIASEYGRLALDFEQISIAKQMLAIADDPGQPDWRVISARGTIAAKEGKYADAIPLYERAMVLSQEQTSVMNNLAMAYAMAGEPAKAEDLLRRVEAKGGNAKSRQNLALVLGLQGKFEEAKQVGSQDLGQQGAAADADMIRRMVKLEGQAAPVVAKATKASASAKAAPPVSSATWNDGDSEADGNGPVLKGMSH